MFRKRLVSLVLCFTLVVACLPVFSLSSSADNEGFCQIRIFYKYKDSSGNWTGELSAIITDDSFLPIPINGSQDVQITRFLVRNDSESLCYFQFDINFGAYVPNSGTWPAVRHSSLAFTTNGGVTAYSFDATDKSHVMVPYQFQNDIHYNEVYFATQRTFFGKCSSSGYITFNSPVILTYSPAPSYSTYLYIYFRHLVIGTDNSAYLVNLENTLNNIDTNVNQIADWMEEEHDLFEDQWQNGGGDAYEELASDNQSLWSTLRGLFGFTVFGGLFSLDIFNTSNSLFGNWFSQTNSDNINGSNKKAPGETEYINYFEKNQNGELDVFGLGGENND